MKNSASINRRLCVLVVLAAALLFVFLLSPKAEAQAPYTLKYGAETKISWHVKGCNINPDIEKVEIVIPAVHNAYPVTTIGKNAFKDCTQITDITLSTNITTIASDAFDGCSKSLKFHLMCGTPEYVMTYVEDKGFSYDIVHDTAPKITYPTCTTQGYTTYSCSGCGINYKDNYTLPLGHSYSPIITRPTCTEGGYTDYK